MIDRKKKIKIAQLIFLIFGTIILIFTYVIKEKSSEEVIILPDWPTAINLPAS